MDGHKTIIKMATFVFEAELIRLPGESTALRNEYGGTDAKTLGSSVDRFE